MADAPMTSIYQLRAAAQPMPSDWVDPYATPVIADHHAFAAVKAASGLTFWADAATFQPPIDSTYPYPVFGFRADSGSSTDGHADENWAYCDSHPDRVRVVLPYVVFKPGRSDAILTRLKNLLGSECPPQVVPEIDMESGTQFAGPGDHSSEANDFAATLAGWSGKQARLQGYANAPDWAGNWPHSPAWMKRRLAAYSSGQTSDGYYSRQYYGALPYASPAGYPRSCPPFGGYVDMNVIPRTIDQILVDFGITQPAPPPTPAKEADMELWLLKGTPSGFWLAGGTAITSNENSTRQEFINQGGKVYTISDPDEFNRIRKAYSS